MKPTAEQLRKSALDAIAAECATLRNEPIPPGYFTAEEIASKTGNSLHYAKTLCRQKVREGKMKQASVVRDVGGTSRRITVFALA